MEDIALPHLEARAVASEVSDTVTFAQPILWTWWHPQLRTETSCSQVLVRSPYRNVIKVEGIARLKALMQCINAFALAFALRALKFCLEFITRIYEGASLQIWDV